MSAIRFIHTADLHLGSPFKGMTDLPEEGVRQLRESTFTAFGHLVDHALATKPDFILIVGDLYDGENRSLHAQQRFQEAMRKLNEANIPVVISYGNHDHLSGRWVRFELPPNVHVFGEEVGQFELDIRGQRVVIHGFSYETRHIREAKIEQFPIAEMDGAVHIGMLHGSLAGDVSHDVYAPFTKAQLIEKRYDYWGLGHIHLRQQLHADPPIVYPGNVQGRHRNERSWKGFYDVLLTKTHVQLDFVPTSAIIFERLTVSCEGIRHANELLQTCIEEIETFKEQYPAGIVELILNDIDEETAELINETTEEEWLTVIRESVKEQDRFVWVQRISFQQGKVGDMASTGLVQSVTAEMAWTDEEWKTLLKDVYQHVQAAKYLERLTEEEIEEVKVEAEKILSNEMR